LSSTRCATFLASPLPCSLVKCFLSGHSGLPLRRQCSIQAAWRARCRRGSLQAHACRPRGEGGTGPLVFIWLDKVRHFLGLSVALFIGLVVSEWTQRGHPAGPRRRQCIQDLQRNVVQVDNSVLTVRSVCLLRCSDTILCCAELYACSEDARQSLFWS
jgi:hypothetical protein